MEMSNQMDSSALDILVTPDFLPGSIVIKYTKNGTLVGTCIWLNNALFQCTIPECEFYCDYESVKPSHGVVVICGVVVVQFDSRENNTVPFLVADRRKRVLYYSSGRDVARTNHASIVDLDSDGTRWEGDTVGGDPYGWGILYDGDNNVLYEGFQVEHTRVCYGTLYYSDIQRVEYSGTLFNGERWGAGVMNMRNGSELYRGPWKEDAHFTVEDEQVKEEFEGLVVRQLKSTLRIEKDSYQTSVCHVDYSFISSLRELVIERNCFCESYAFSLIGMSALTTLRIGSGCFCMEQGMGCSCCIKKCSALESIMIGGSSFEHYSALELSGGLNGNGVMDRPAFVDGVGDREVVGLRHDGKRQVYE